MLVRNMKRNEILGLLAVLVPGSVWAGIDYRELSDEREKLPQPSLDVFRDTIEEDAASGDMMIAIRKSLLN